MKKTKKLLAFVLACIMMFSTTIAVAASTTKFGDVNGDSNVNSSDALLVLQHNVGLIQLDDEKKDRADVTDDGRLNSSDALIILKIAVGLYEEEEQEPVPEVYTTLVNYILENGQILDGYIWKGIAKEYTNSRGREKIYIFYAEELGVLRFENVSYYGSYQSISLDYKPGETKQSIFYMISTGGGSFVGRGKIDIEEYVAYSDTIYDFDGYPPAGIESAGNAITKMLTNMGPLLEETGLGITLYDLGFTAWVPPVIEDSPVEEPTEPPYTRLVNYLIENGRCYSGSSRHLIYRDNTANGKPVTTYIVYNTETEELTFELVLKELSNNATGRCTIHYNPNSNRYKVSLKVDFWDIPDLTATGAIDDCFSRNGGYIYNYSCSDRSQSDFMEVLLEESLVTMLIIVDSLMRSTGLGIDLYDFGFKYW